MKWIVWAALAVAGVGYWWFEYRKWQKTYLGQSYNWTYGDEDAHDTAEHVARFYEAIR